MLIFYKAASDSSGGEDKSSLQKVASAAKDAKDTAKKVASVAAAAASVAAAVTAPASSAPSGEAEGVQSPFSTNVVSTGSAQAPSSPAKAKSRSSSASSESSAQGSGQEDTQDSAQESDESQVYSEDESEEIVQEDTKDSHTELEPNPNKKKANTKDLEGKTPQELMEFVEENPDRTDDVKAHIDNVIRSAPEQYVKTTLKEKEASWTMNMAAGAAAMPKTLMSRTTNRFARKISEAAGEEAEERNYANRMEIFFYALAKDDKIDKIIEHDFTHVKDMKFEYQFLDDNNTPTELVGSMVFIRQPMKYSASVYNKPKEFKEYIEKRLKENPSWDLRSGDKTDGTEAGVKRAKFPMKAFIEFYSGNKGLLTIEFREIFNVAILGADLNAEFPGIESYVILGKVAVHDSTMGRTALFRPSYKKDPNKAFNDSAEWDLDQREAVKEKQSVSYDDGKSAGDADTHKDLYSSGKESTPSYSEQSVSYKANEYAGDSRNDLYKSHDNTYTSEDSEDYSQSYYSSSELIQGSSEYSYTDNGGSQSSKNDQEEGYTETMSGVIKGKKGK